MLPESVQPRMMPSFRPTTPPMAFRPFIVPVLPQWSMTWFSPFTPTTPPMMETRSSPLPSSSESAFAASVYFCARR